MVRCTRRISRSGSSPIACRSVCKLQIHKHIWGDMFAASSKAVVLLSGGLDTYPPPPLRARPASYIYALTVKYGEDTPTSAARKVAEALGAKAHRELAADLDALGGLALLGDGEVPKDGPRPDTIPAMYVPARNTVMLALALAWAEVLGGTISFWASTPSITPGIRIAGWSLSRRSRRPA